MERTWPSPGRPFWADSRLLLWVQGAWHGAVSARLGVVLPAGLGTPEGLRGGTCHFGAACAGRAAGLLGAARVGQAPAGCTLALPTSSHLFPPLPRKEVPPPGSFWPRTCAPEQGLQVSPVAGHRTELRILGDCPWHQRLPPGTRSQTLQLGSRGRSGRASRVRAREPAVCTPWGLRGAGFCL